MTAFAQPLPDDKDWTWVLSRPCPECGYDTSVVSLDRLPGRIDRVVDTFATRLADADAATRPQPEIWSPVEYACHVRDVCTKFRGRLEQMLDEDNPLFENWDQDATALESRYWEQDPAQVLAELRSAAAAISSAFAAVPHEQYVRRGRRSDGAVFTVDSLGRYFLHDLVHHAWDIAASR